MTLKPLAFFCTSTFTIPSVHPTLLREETVTAGGRGRDPNAGLTDASGNHSFKKKKNKTTWNALIKETNQEKFLKQERSPLETTEEKGKLERTKGKIELQGRK